MVKGLRPASRECWRLGLLVLSVGSCGVGPTDLGRCSGELPLTVDQREGLRFTWEPADCPMYTLVVDEARVIRWSIWSSDDSRNQIGSGVEYGQVPPNAVEQSRGADPLLARNRYRVAVTRIDEEGSQVTAGTAYFIKD